MQISLQNTLVQNAAQNALSNLKTANDAKNNNAANSDVSNATSKKEAKEKEKLANMQSALETMKSSKNDASEMKKSMAVARFQQLSQQIEMLKKNFSGDPKVLAKQIARLMKELKSIAKQYGEAIGSAANNISGNYSATQNTQQTNATKAAEQSGNNNLNNQDLPQQELNTETSNALSDDAATGKTANDNLGVNDKNKPTSNNNDDKKADKEEQRKNEISYWSQIAKNGEGDEFLKKLRKAADDLKNLFEINKAAVKFTYPDDKDAEKDIKEFEKDYKATLKELESIESSTRFAANTGNLVSITI